MTDNQIQLSTEAVLEEMRQLKVQSDYDKDFTIATLRAVITQQQARINDLEAAAGTGSPDQDDQADNQQHDDQRRTEEQPAEKPRTQHDNDDQQQNPKQSGKHNSPPGVT